MKGNLGVLFFVVCICAANGYNKSQSRNLGSLARYSKSFKAGGDTCDLICDADQEDNSNGKNWLLEIEGGIFISFNANFNFFSIFNTNLKIAIILDIRGYIGIFNTITKSAILTHTKSRKSTCIQSAAIPQFVKPNFDIKKAYYAGFKNAYDILNTNINIVSPSIDINSGLNFDMSTVITGLSNSLSISAIYKSRTNLVTALGDFDILFSKISQGFGSSTIEYITYTEAAIFAPMVNIVTTKYEITYELLKLYNIIVNRLCGTFTSDMFTEIRKAVKLTNAYSKLQNMNIVLTGVGAIYTDVSTAIITYSNNLIPTYNEKNSIIGNKISRAVWLKSDHNWVFDISLIGEISGNFIIIFNADEGSLAILDKKEGLGAVFFIKSTLFGVYNVASGVGMAYQSTSGKAVYIEKNKDAIKIAFENCKFSAAVSLITENIYATPSSAFTQPTAYNMQQFMLGKSTNTVLNKEFDYLLRNNKLMGYSGDNGSTPYDVILVILKSVPGNPLSSFLVQFTMQFFTGLIQLLGVEFTDTLYKLIEVSINGDLTKAANIDIQDS